MRLLIMGGSAEATLLAHRLAGRSDIDPILSFAGRTQNPVKPPIPCRVGGFGGVSGLKTYLTQNRIEAVVGASHPFAAQIAANAMEACGALRLPFAILTRPPWRRRAGDRWTSVATMADAARALGECPRRVFLSVGGGQLAAFAIAPQHHFLVRAIETPDAIGALPDRRLVLARGPFCVVDEIALMREHRIDALVTKNSGGRMTEAKLEAARALNVEVIMIERPGRTNAPAFESVDAIVAWIDDHRRTP